MSALQTMSTSEVFVDQEIDQVFDQDEQETENTQNVENQEQEQRQEQSRVEPNRNDFVLTGDDHRVLQLTKGYHSAWLQEDSTGVSFNSEWKDVPLEVVPADITARALLAAIAFAMSKLPKDASQAPILAAVARSGYVEFALKVIQIADNASTSNSEGGTDFLRRYYRIKYAKDTFNHRVNVGMTELKTNITSTSIWTLIKHLHTQVCYAINRFYKPVYRDLPIVAEPVESSNQSKTSAKSKAKSADKKRHEVPTTRTPEDALWYERASCDLALALYDISDTYNRVLQTTPDLSQAYRVHGMIQREQKTKQWEERKTQYESKRKELSEAKSQGQTSSSDKSQQRQSQNQSQNQSQSQSQSQSKSQTGPGSEMKPFSDDKPWKPVGTKRPNQQQTQNQQDQRQDQNQDQSQDQSQPSLQNANSRVQVKGKQGGRGQGSQGQKQNGGGRGKGQNKQGRGQNNKQSNQSR